MSIKTNRPSLRSYALNLLAKREYSRQGLAAKLKTRQQQTANEVFEGTSEHEAVQTVDQSIDQILDEFADKKWLSDERFSQVVARQKSARMGNRALSFQLQQQGVETDTVSQALAGLEDETARARDLIANKLNRRFRHRQDETQGASLLTMDERQKLVQFLLRRGFGSRAINQAFDRLIQERSEQNKHNLSKE